MLHLVLLQGLLKTQTILHQDQTTRLLQEAILPQIAGLIQMPVAKEVHQATPVLPTREVPPLTVAVEVPVEGDKFLYNSLKTPTLNYIGRCFF